jgi:hypothetical protein
VEVLNTDQGEWQIDIAGPNPVSFQFEGAGPARSLTVAGVPFVKRQVPAP